MMHNRPRRILAFSLIMMLVLSVPAFALDAGLGSFGDVNQYTDEVFSDVKAGDWFSGGVKTACEKGVMGGMAAGKFVPSGQVTWTQAVTIAARLHAAYNGIEIPEADGVWYVRYFDYAGEVDILPSTCPPVDEVDGAIITRKEMAGLFRKVLKPEDLPVINTSVPPDLASIDTEFRSAAGEMYASGIITGKDGGRFDPEGKLTRAEIATIVARLICPAQRVGSDKKVNQMMADQQGNFTANGGIAVEGNGATWFLLREQTVKGEDIVLSHTIIAKTDSEKISTLYNAGEDRLFKLSVGDDGMLYFIRRDEKAWHDSLLCLDPVSGKAETLYTGRKWIDGYTFYDGDIYLVECLNTSVSISNWPYRVGKLENGTVKPLLNNTTYAKASNSAESLYAFNGKLYFLYGDEMASGNYYKDALYSLDMRSGQLERVVDGKNGKTIYMSDVAYTGATAWTIGLGDGDNWVINRVNLLMPEFVEKVSELTKETSVLYPNLYANGSKVYYQASSASRLWEISTTGTLSPKMEMPTPYYEHSTVLGGGTIAHMLAGVTQQDNGSFDIQLPNGTIENYLAYLGRPYLEKGHCNLPAAPGTEETWASPEKVADYYNDNKIRQYLTKDGSFVVEIELVTDKDEDRTISALDFTLKWSGGKLSRSFGLNDAVKKDTRYVYSVVVPISVLQEEGATGSFEPSWSFRAREN